MIDYNNDNKANFNINGNKDNNNTINNQDNFYSNDN